MTDAREPPKTRPAEPGWRAWTTCSSTVATSAPRLAALIWVP